MIYEILDQVRQVDAVYLQVQRMHEDSQSLACGEILMVLRVQIKS